jgi:hypothetical protein
MHIVTVCIILYDCVIPKSYSIASRCSIKPLLRFQNAKSLEQSIKITPVRILNHVPVLLTSNSIRLDRQVGSSGKLR